MSKNNITGDNLVSKPTQGYQDGYDRIWGKVILTRPASNFETSISDNYEEIGSCVIKDNEKVTND